MCPAHRHSLSAVTLFLLALSTAAASAEGDSWRVAKLSGEVWVTTKGAQQAALGGDAIVQPGQDIRTGRTGRVLLVRGEERILVSPNSAIGIPAEKKDNLSTTITQQAGTILLKVEKRNVQHFEVETPYLAAVVKGTRFRVSVDGKGSRVQVLRGQVQVSDFKSGDHLLVMPGQTVRNSSRISGGLLLSGSGLFNRIEHGTPRPAGVRAAVTPASNSLAKRTGAEGRTHRAATRGHGTVSAGHEAALTRTAKGGIRISAPLGEVKLDFKKATHGLVLGGKDSIVSAKRSGSGSSSATSENDTQTRGSNGQNAGAGLTSGESGPGGTSSGSGAAGSSGTSSLNAGPTVKDHKPPKDHKPHKPPPHGH